MISPERLLRRAAVAPRIVRQLLRHGRPSRMLLFGPLSLGDDLLCTTALHEGRRRGKPFAMMTNRPELFAQNPDPAALIPIDDYHAASLRLLGTRVTQPYYSYNDPQQPNRDINPPGHILAEMCRLAGITGEISLRPYLHLTAEEKAAGKLRPRQIAIQSSAAAAALPFATKEWGAGRFAAVVEALSPEFDFVQIGSPRDPLLPGVLDLRGKTTLRQSAAVLAASMTFVGLEGFLTHLARAVDCPSTVIFGGRIHPETVGYPCNANIYNAVPCAPCGLRNGCPYDLMCMHGISPADVAVATRVLANTPRTQPLAVATVVIPAATS